MEADFSMWVKIGKVANVEELSLFLLSRRLKGIFSVLEINSMIESKAGIWK